MAGPTVILVPGFGGSRLRDVLHPLYFVGMGDVWMCPPTLLSGGWRNMRLPVPGEPPPPPGYRPLVPGGPLTPYYRFLTDALSVLGWRVVTVTADWRFPIPIDAAVVADAVRREAGEGQVHLVCHSRGGLVARYALRLLAATGDIGKVARVVTLGTPHTGSLAAAQALAGTHRLLTRLQEIQGYVPRMVSDAVGLPDVFEMVRTWPAVYELLPPPGAPWLTLDPPDLLYRAETWAGSPVRPVQAYLDSAKLRWTQLQEPVTGAPPIYTVSGYGLATAVGLPDPAALLRGGAYAVTDQGDRTVPIESARLAGAHLLLTPTDHNFLPLDPRLYPHVHAALTGALDADKTLAGPVLTLG